MEALALNPNLPKVWHNRGCALAYLGQYEEAIDPG
ncbi:MAG: tetratricopeptide repeat protein [Prochloron sp. SP5CPC1]|nr:tetratricopeptide repeat protein [Candidatus Paraprochloron terpiosi SP5CPC1]